MGRTTPVSLAVITRAVRVLEALASSCKCVLAVVTSPVGFFSTSSVRLLAVIKSSVCLLAAITSSVGLLAVLVSSVRPLAVITSWVRLLAFIKSLLCLALTTSVVLFAVITTTVGPLAVPTFLVRRAVVAIRSLMTLGASTCTRRGVASASRWRMRISFTERVLCVKMRWDDRRSLVLWL